VPVNIADLSVGEIIEAAKAQGGLLSPELATELKQNKLMHWFVTHPDDIAMANFLTGEKKQYFENLEGLDITELRALSLCIPEKFELDGDGRKMEWRSRLVARAKLVVSQFNGDSVKGGWDGDINCRMMVALPPLKPEQERRAIYFYRTKEQCAQRLKQYDYKQATLAKKEEWLRKAEEQANEAKKELDTILNEMRDPELKQQYGAEQFLRAKELAKQEWSELESKKKSLSRDVQSLRSAIAANPVSRDHFATAMQEMQDYLVGRGYDWHLDNAEPILVSRSLECAYDTVRYQVIRMST
jgi:hypothetical protein